MTLSSDRGAHRDAPSRRATLLFLFSCSQFRQRNLDVVEFVDSFQRVLPDGLRSTQRLDLVQTNFHEPVVAVGIVASTPHPDFVFFSNLAVPKGEEGRGKQMQGLCSTDRT